MIAGLIIGFVAGLVVGPMLGLKPLQSEDPAKARAEAQQQRDERSKK